jgi:hypothetical protein
MNWFLMIWLSAAQGGHLAITAPVQLPGDYSSEDQCAEFANKKIIPNIISSMEGNDDYRVHWWCQPKHVGGLSVGLVK